MILAIWGPEKSWKTTMALTFPRPLVHFDLDVGGFDRAIWRIDDTSGIESKPYPTPIQIEKLLGQTKDGVSIRFPKKIFGIKEVWQQIVVDFVNAATREDVKSIVVDSATQLWSICHRGYLQEVQERQVYKFLHDSNGVRIRGREEDEFPPNEFRERLRSLEYGDPNERMRSLIYTARSYRKHLVLTHYPRDVYAEKPTDRGIESYKTGDIEPDGFRDTQKLVDIVIWTGVDSSGQGQAKITRCGLEGLGTTAVGLTVDPSYEGIIRLRESMKGE